MEVTLIICVFLIGAILLTSLLIGLFVPVLSQKSGSQNAIPKNLLIAWLKNQRAKGKITIDELLNELQEDDNRKALKEIGSIETPPAQTGNYHNAKETTAAKEYQKPEENPQESGKSLFEYLNAIVLLYTGTAFVVFSIFILVAFNWQSIADIVKSIILIIMIVSFYSGGLILNNVKNLKPASITFLSIASIALGFSGIGFWRFELSELLQVEFYQYWTVYSFMIGCVYILTMYFTGQRRYLALAIATIYSFIISLAFTLTDDEKFRIVIIAVLNLLFYSSQKLWGGYAFPLRATSRIVNSVLDFVIFFVVLFNSHNIFENHMQPIAILGISVPIIFSLLTELFEKEGFELSLGVVSAPFKILLISLIFEFKAEILVYILLAYAVGIEALSKFYFARSKHDHRYYLSLIPVAGIVGITSLYVGFSSILNTSGITIISKVSDTFLLITLIGGFITLNLGSILKLIILNGKDNKFQNIDTLIPSAGLLHLLWMIFIFIHKYMMNPPEVLPYFIVYSLTTLIFVIVLHISRQRFKWVEYVLIPVIVTSSVVNTIMSFAGGTEYLLGVSLICLAYSIISRVATYMNHKTSDLIYISSINSIILTITVFIASIFPGEELYLVYAILLSNISLTIIEKKHNFVVFTWISTLLLSLKLVFTSEFFVDETTYVLSLLTGFAVLNIRPIINSLSGKATQDGNMQMGIGFLYIILVIFAFVEEFWASPSILVFLVSYIILFGVSGVVAAYARNSLDWLRQATLPLFGVTSIIVSVISIFSFDERYLAFTSFIWMLSALLFHTTKEKYPLFRHFAFITLANIPITLAYVGLSILFGNRNDYTAMTAVFCGIGFIFLNGLNSMLPNLYGIGIVLAIWNYLLGYDYSLNFYSIPVVIYIGTLAIRYQLKKNYPISLVLEISAYSIQYLVLLLLSLAETTDVLRILNGIALIVMATIVIVFSLARKKYIVSMISGMVIALELFIRLYSVIISIPWWIYLGLIGIGIIALAIYILVKVGAKKN